MQYDENGILIMQKEDELERYNIAIERRPHYCTHASKDINSKDESIGQNIDINKEIESNTIIINNEINDKDKKSNNINEQEQNSNKTTIASCKSDNEDIFHEEDIK